jgi:hypothetical protein
MTSTWLAVYWSKRELELANFIGDSQIEGHARVMNPETEYIREVCPWVNVWS